MYPTSLFLTSDIWSSYILCWPFLCNFSQSIIHFFISNSVTHNATLVSGSEEDAVCTQINTVLSWSREQALIVFNVDGAVHQRDATYTMLFIIISALHVSGGFSAHHQELIKLYMQPWVLSCFPAVYRCCGGVVLERWNNTTQPHQR